MALGLKRIFRRKAKAEKGVVRTPEKTKNVPETPPTQPVKEDPPANERRDDRRDDLPVKNLLETLNIHDFEIGTTNSGDTDPVFEDTEYPEDEPTIVPAQLHNSAYSRTPPRGGVSLLQEEEEEVDTSFEQSEDSPLRPRQLESSGLVFRDEDSLVEPVVDQLVEKAQVIGASRGKTYDAANTIMNIYERAKQCATAPCAGGFLVPGPVQKLVPTVDNAMLCQPFGGVRQRSDLSSKRPKLVRQYSYYDEQFALKFLDVSVLLLSV